MIQLKSSCETPSGQIEIFFGGGFALIFLAEYARIVFIRILFGMVVLKYPHLSFTRRSKFYTVNRFACITLLL